MSADERDLVRDCLANDPVAMRSLVERFQVEVFPVCFRLLHHRQDAEDVTQETFLRVFRSLHRWDSTRPLRPWIIGIAVNRCRTWLSNRARRPELVDYLAEVAADTPADDGAELAREIAAALCELRHEYQTVFVLFHERSQSYDEIALALGRPVGTIKTWLHRARQEVLDRLHRRGMMPDHLPDPAPDVKR